jgi:hypothetical protein
MKQNASRILLATLWLASIAAAYFVGQGGTSAPSQAGKSNETTSSLGSADGTTRKSDRIVEAFSETEGKAPSEKKDVINLVARARAELAGGMNGMMNLRGMLRAIAPLAELDDAQIQEALTEVEKAVREPQQKMMFYSILLGQWAESDGPAALKYAEEKLKTKTPFDFGVRGTIIGSWARRDPDAAWRWYQSNREASESDPNSQMTLSAVFAGMAGKDLDGAITRLNTLNDQERAMAVNGLASTAWDETSRRRLIDRSASLPAETRKQLQENLIRSWSMSDPEAAVKWLRTRPEEEQPGLRSAAGQMVMMSDPKRGADLLLDGVQDKERPRVYDTIVGQWAYRDPRGAAEWLTKQPQGQELDGARRTFVSIVANRDPSAAMDWAKSIVNPEQRVASIQQAYTTWRGKDAGAADTALDTSGLPEEKIAELKQNAPKSNPAKNP